MYTRSKPIPVGHVANVFKARDWIIEQTGVSPVPGLDLIEVLASALDGDDFGEGLTLEEVQALVLKVAKQRNDVFAGLYGVEDDD